MSAITPRLSRVASSMMARMRNRRLGPNTSDRKSSDQRSYGRVGTTSAARGFQWRASCPAFASRQGLPRGRGGRASSCSWSFPRGPGGRRCADSRSGGVRRRSHACVRGYSHPSSRVCGALSTDRRQQGARRGLGRDQTSRSSSAPPCDAPVGPSALSQNVFQRRNIEMGVGQKPPQLRVR